MSAVEKALNDIFRVQQRRRFMVKFMTYWTVFDLGPLLPPASRY